MNTLSERESKENASQGSLVHFFSHMLTAAIRTVATSPEQAAVIIILCVCGQGHDNLYCIFTDLGGFFPLV